MNLLNTNYLPYTLLHDLFLIALVFPHNILITTLLQVKKLGLGEVQYLTHDYISSGGHTFNRLDSMPRGDLFIQSTNKYY